MKIAKNLISLFVFILAVVCFGGCSHLDKTDVKTVISNELNLLKNLDSDTAQKYVSYKELFPDATTETSLSQEVEEVFSLFFQDFDYQILDLDVDEDKKEATSKDKADYHRCSDLSFRLRRSFPQSSNPQGSQF